MITIHHLTRSRSERIVWLMEELGLEYRLDIHRREANGIVLAESGAIVDYIVHRYGKGRLAVASQAPEYAGYLYWLHFAEGSLMSLMLIVLTVSRIPEAKESPVRARLADRMARMLALVDEKLAGHDYFAGGEFTAADVMMVFPLTTMRHFLDYDLSPYANIRAYLARIEARPAYRKAMAIAGPEQ